jgi:hypothetical protein
MAQLSCPLTTGRIFPQLQSNTASGGADCGPSAALQTLYLVSCGQFRWTTGTSGRQERSDLIVKQRTKSGTYTGYDSSTTVSQNVTGFNKWKTEFNALGLTRPVMTGYIGQNVETILKPAIRDDGMIAMIAVDYKPIANWNGKIYAGGCNNPDTADENEVDFQHMMTIHNWHVIEGVAHVTVLDPLNDGRYSGNCGRTVHQGYYSIPWSVIKTAMGQFSVLTFGYGSFGLTERVSTLTTAPPPEHVTSAPVLGYPISSQVTNLLTPTFTASRGSTADIIESYNIILYASNGTTVIHDFGYMSGGITVAQNQFSINYENVPGAPALAYSTTYKWKARINQAGQTGNAGPFSAQETFITPDEPEEEDPPPEEEPPPPPPPEEDPTDEPDEPDDPTPYSPCGQETEGLDEG